VWPDWFQCRLSHSRFRTRLSGDSRPPWYRKCSAGQVADWDADSLDMMQGSLPSRHFLRQNLVSLSALPAPLRESRLPNRWRRLRTPAGATGPESWRLKADVGTSKAPSPKLDWIARFDYAARAVVYGLAGLFSLAPSTGHGGHSY
jgi:hypothetical protein